MSEKTCPWVENCLMGLALRSVKAVFAGKAPPPLIAAMRCYVASKLGDEVDIPEELV